MRLRKLAARRLCKCCCGESDTLASCMGAGDDTCIFVQPFFWQLDIKCVVPPPRALIDAAHSPHADRFVYSRVFKLCVLLKCGKWFRVLVAWRSPTQQLRPHFLLKVAFIRTHLTNIIIFMFINKYSEKRSVIWPSPLRGGTTFPERWLERWMVHRTIDHVRSPSLRAEEVSDI